MITPLFLLRAIMMLKPEDTLALPKAIFGN
jgi:hypothetical protein